MLRSLLYYEPRKAAVWPACVLGIMYALVTSFVVDESPFPGILLVSIIGFIQGLCFLYVIAFGMSVVSSWFNGYGLFDQIKLIVSWSCFPFIIGVPIFLAIAIPFIMLWPDSTPVAGIIIGITYLVIAGLWGLYIQWSGIRVLFRGDKVSPAAMIVIPYMLFAIFVFITQQLYVLFH